MVNRWRNRRLRAVLLGAAALILGSVLPSLDAATSSAASHANAAPSGTINWYGQGLVIGTWDPTLSSAGHDVADLSLVYAALTRIAANGSVGPGLATSWYSSPNKLALFFNIRKGVKFTDGTTVNATAVKDTLDRARTVAGSSTAAVLTSIKSETVVSPYLLRINLISRAPSLPYTLGGKAGMIISAAALNDPTRLAALSTQPDGAGPFELTQFVAQGYADLVRNPHYWDAKNIHVAGLYISGNTTAATTLAALQSGQANVAVINGSEIAAAKAAGFTVRVIPTLSVAYISINNQIAPFTNPLVDEAINYAINREALVQAVGFGVGTPNDEPFPKGYYCYSAAAANDFSYNPTKAASLLTQAGYPGGAGLNLTFTATLPSPVTEAIQAQLQAVGIQSTIVGIPSSQLTQDLYIEHNIGLLSTGFIGRESAVAALQVIWGAGGLLNVGHTITTALNRAINNVATDPLSDPNYDKTCAAATAIGVTSNPNIWLYSSPTIWAYAPSVHGVVSYIDFQRFEGVTISS